MSRGFPSMTALLGLLAVAGYQNRDKIAEMLGGAQGGAGQPGTRQIGTDGRDVGHSSAHEGSLLGNLATAFGGAGVGSFLSGGLNDLVNSFKQNGQGEVVDSWVGSGPNKEIPPHQLEQGIGRDTLAELSRQTGLSHEDLLSRLSRELPRAVDQYTPRGRVPSETEI